MQNAMASSVSVIFRSGQIFAGAEHVLQLLPHLDRIGQQEVADAPIGRAEVPERDQPDQEGDLHGAADELVAPVLPRRS